MKGIMIAASLAAIACATGCARFEFRNTSDASGTEQGLKLYTPKPYVLVAREGGNDKPVDVKIVYLPDLANPYYVTARSGWGSSNLTMTISDGMMTEFGQQVDNNGAATLTGVTGLVTALSADKSLERRKQPGDKPLEFSLYEIDNTKTPAELREVVIPTPNTEQHAPHKR